MPKPVRELEEKQRPLDEQVITLLAKDPTTAYTVEEIVARVEGTRSAEVVTMIEFVMILKSPEERAGILAPWLRALNLLEKSGRVRTFKDGDTVYYALAGKP